MLVDDEQKTKECEYTEHRFRLIQFKIEKIPEKLSISIEKTVFNFISLCRYRFGSRSVVTANQYILRQGELNACNYFDIFLLNRIAELSGARQKSAGDGRQ